MSDHSSKLIFYKSKIVNKLNLILSGFNLITFKIYHLKFIEYKNSCFTSDHVIKKINNFIKMSSSSREITHKNLNNTLDDAEELESEINLKKSQR